LRLADWPRNPYLNDELREWVQLHLETLGTEDVAIYALAASGQDDERRVLVATDIGLLDSWYAPHGSTARFSLSVRLYPWTAVRGVDLRGETFRLWAHEHQSRWRLRLARPALDTMADTPDLGRALAEFAAVCSANAEPSGAATQPPRVEDAIPAFLGRAAAAEAALHPQPRPERPAVAPAPRSPAPKPDEAETSAEADAPRNGTPSEVPPAPPVSPAEPASSASPVSPTPDQHLVSAAAPAVSSSDAVGELERRLGLRQPDR
jgi:hypothetical protein